MKGVKIPFKFARQESAPPSIMTNGGTLPGCCRTLGTPTEETWPGVSQMPDYKANFPCWKGSQLHTSIKNLCNQGMDLLQVIHHRGKAV